MLRLQFAPSLIPRLATEYRVEEDADALAAGRAIVAGDFSRKHLATIFEWKTRGRGRTRLLANSRKEVTDALRLACAAKTERAAIAVLTGLSGVSVPVASAILTAIYPRRYTIIDFRALEALGCKEPFPAATVAFYLLYLVRCRELAAKHGVGLRELDRALWQWSKTMGPSVKPRG